MSLARSGHYEKVDCTPTFQFSFFNHKVKLWNDAAYLSISQQCSLYINYFKNLVKRIYQDQLIRPFDIWYKGVPPEGRYMGFPCIKIFVCLHTVVRPSSCGMLVWRRSSEGLYTSFTTKCRSCVLPAANFWTKFREEGEMAPKSREGGRFTLLYLPPPLGDFSTSYSK